MASRELRLVVITPERQVLDELVASAVIPAHDGELGILPGRAPLMCELGSGQIRYESTGGTLRLLVDGGFAQVNHDRVTVLTTAVYRPEEITDETIAAAQAAAAEIRGAGDEQVQARAQARRKIDLMRSLRTVG